jgi:DNA-binding transcriptional ArsR family regulator
LSIGLLSSLSAQVPTSKLGRRPILSQQDQQEERRMKLEKALAHPVRADVLARLSDAPNSAVQISEELALPRQTVNHHIRYLLKLDCIEEIGQVPVRGAVKKIYLAKEKMYIGPEAWGGLSLHARNGISLNIAAECVERLQAALKEGTFDKRKDRIAGNWILRLDEQGWQEAWEMLSEVVDRFKEMEGEAIERNPDHLNRSPFTYSIFAYESPAKGNAGRTRMNPPYDDKPT